MFTWICPKCGREVPPAYDECPDCAAKAASQAVAGSAPPPPQSIPAAPPSSATKGGRRPLWATGAQESIPAAPVPPPPRPEPPPVYQPAQPTSPMFQAPPPQSPQPTYAVAQPTGFRMPTWAMAVLFGGIFVGILYGAYTLLGHHADTTSAVIEAPPPAAGAPTENPAQKYIEVAGLRFSPITKGIQVAFVLVNHSDSDIVGLTGTATILAKTDKGDETPVGTVDFQTSIPAQASKEMQLPFTTKKKLMELPDWQNVEVKVKITGPTASGPA